MPVTAVIYDANARGRFEERTSHSGRQDVCDQDQEGASPTPPHPAPCVLHMPAYLRGVR